MQIKLHPKKTVWILGMGIATLTLLHLIACIPFFFMGRSHPFAPLNMECEQNIPTMFSAALLWFSALLVGGIAWGYKRDGWYKALPWFGLAVAFLFMGLDESIELHEQLTEPLRDILGARGLFFYAWVIPYILFTLLFAIVYVRFVLELPGDTRKFVLIAAILYISGCIGVEMIGGAWMESYGRFSLYYPLAMVEELLEMSGSTVFIYAFLNHIDKHLPGFCLRITSS